MYTANSKLDKKTADRAIAHVKQQLTYLQTLLTTHRTKWEDFFRATYIFENDRKGKGKSQLFFPKCFEQVEKVSPRLTANDPRFAVTPIIVGTDEGEDVAGVIKRADSTQKYLHYAWSITNGRQKLKDVTKGGLVYGTMLAKVGFETRKKITKTTEAEDDGALYDVTKETISLEYPTFEALDILEVYFDPRIKFVDDMPAIIHHKAEVRLNELMENKEHYINTDKLEELNASFSDISDNKLNNKFSNQGIADITDEGSCYVDVKEFYGYFNEEEYSGVDSEKGEGKKHEEGESGEDKLMLITVVNDSIVIEYKELSFMPFEKYTPITIPNQGVGVGIVEPIYDIQKAYNLTRNQRFENVTLIMNRMWLLKQSAGIDPRRLQSFPGNVIPVKDMDGIQALPTPDITSSSYNETDALNTEIQSVLGTIDTTQDSSSNGFTNLATGQKIRWNEFNARFRSMKENLEDFMSALGRKMLLMVSERATMNPKIYDKETRKFYEIAKDSFDGFDDFFNVRVVADSTSYDSIESARDNALAKAQILSEYAAMGVNVDLDKALKDILNTFPGTIAEEYVLPPKPEQKQPDGGAMSQKTIDQAKPQLTPEDQLNQSLTNV